MFFCFSIFEAVWRSRNLERVYIFSTKAILQPPCRRYGGDPVTKKIDNPKILDTYFSVFRYLKPFGAHATSNVFIQVYIYIIIRANLRLPCRRYRGGSSTKKIDIKKYQTRVFLFSDIRSRLALTQPRMFIYRYIYIYI